MATLTGIRFVTSSIALLSSSSCSLLWWCAVVGAAGRLSAWYVPVAVEAAAMAFPWLLLIAVFKAGRAGHRPGCSAGRRIDPVGRCSACDDGRADRDGPATFADNDDTDCSGFRRIVLFLMATFDGQVSGGSSPSPACSPGMNDGAARG